ncbi:MAG: type IV pilus assembly protein PilM [Candidatus Margulisiibacteriota bacterium]|nr:type IV pilus assembly protein PilM [Candidatus Margulisiibacteriota bacterium]
MAQKSILGLDLRVRSVKVIEITREPKEFVVSAWGMEEVPMELMEKHPEKEIAQGRLLAHILKSKSIKTRNAVAVMGGQDVYITQISTPKLSKAETLEAIKWRLQEELPFPAEHAVIDYVAAGKAFKNKENEEEIPLIVVAANRPVIDGLVSIAKSAGVRLVSIVPIPMCLKHVFSQQFVGEEMICPVYLGRLTTNISFFKGPSLIFSREVPLGGEDITKAMTSVLVSEEGRLELKYDEAEKIKLEYGVPVDLENYPKLKEIPTAHLQAVVRPALEKISGEIMRTIEYYRNQMGDTPITKIILTGGSAQTPHLAEFLGETLGIPIDVASTFARTKMSFKLQDQEKLQKHTSQMSAALGAALDYFEPDVNLLPEEIREKWKVLARKHARPQEAGILFAVTLLLLYSGLYLYSASLKNQVTSIQSQIDVLKPKLSRLEEIEQAVREEEGRAGIFKRIELDRLKIPIVFKELSDSLPPEVLIERLNLVESSRTLDFGGIVFGKGDTPENILSRFVLTLAKQPSFEKVDLISATKVGGYLYDAFSFQVQAKIKKI